MEELWVYHYYKIPTADIPCGLWYFDDVYRGQGVPFQKRDINFVVCRVDYKNRKIYFKLA
jgi:hypothetical protein